MKKLKMAIMAVAAVSSIGSAFAFSPAAKHDPQTYYAKASADGLTFAWTTVKPRSKCTTTSLNAICSITTSNVPMNNVVPSGHTADGTVYQ